MEKSMSIFVPLYCAIQGAIALPVIKSKVSADGPFKATVAIITRIAVECLFYAAIGIYADAFYKVYAHDSIQKYVFVGSMISLSYVFSSAMEHITKRYLASLY